MNVSLVVTNDSLSEDDKSFVASLTFPGEPIPGVTLNPDIAIVTIYKTSGQGTNLVIFCVRSSL